MTINVIVAVDVEFEAQLVSILNDLDGVAVQARPADETELLAAVVAGTGDVVILGEYFTGADRELVRRVRGNSGKVLGFGEAESAVTAWDVDEHVSPWASPNELSAALRRVSASVKAPPKPDFAPVPSNKAHGKIIAVWGTGSAPGRSTVAANLAHVLSLQDSTVLVDADTVNSVQAALLGVLSDTPQLVTLCRNVEGLSANTVEKTVTVIESRFHVVTGLSRAMRWPEVKPAHLAEVLQTLRSHYTWIVVDVADRIDPDDDFADPFYDRHSATRVVLNSADHTAVVGTGDPMGLKRLVELLDTDRIRNLPDFTTVINRVRASAVGQAPEKTISATLAKFTHVNDPVFIPESLKDVDRAVLAGRTVTELAPRAPFSLAITELSERFAPRRAEPSRARRRKRKMTV